MSEWRWCMDKYRIVIHISTPEENTIKIFPFQYRTLIRAYTTSQCTGRCRCAVAFFRQRRSHPQSMSLLRSDKNSQKTNKNEKTKKRKNEKTKKQTNKQTNNKNTTTKATQKQNENTLLCVYPSIRVSVPVCFSSV